MNISFERIDSSGGDRYYRQYNSDTGETLCCYPSVTTKLSAVYPKDPYLMKWIRQNGMEGEEQFKKSADEGTQVHTIIDQLLHGEKIESEGLSDKVKKCVQAFIDWYQEVKPEILESEITLFNHVYKYAGTRDLLCRINGELFVVDYKTSNSVHDQHKVQVAAYWGAGDMSAKCALLHLGNTTKKKWSFLEFEPQGYWEQYLHFQVTFDLLHPNSKPKVINYPLLFELKFDEKENKKTNNQKT